MTIELPTIELSEYVIDAIADAVVKKMQEQKTGHWEYVQYDGNPKIGNWHCSECNRIICGIIRAGNPVYAYKYCPECGAKMTESEETNT